MTGEGNDTFNSGGGGGGLIGALATAGALIYDSVNQRKNTKDTIAANKKEAELAYQREQEMIRQQNLYNSPAEQMKRFTDAGLNPNLIYGQGSSGNQTAIPKYQRPEQDYRGMPGVMSGVLGALSPAISEYQNFQMRQAQIGQVNAMTENIEAKTVTEGFNSVLKDLMGKKTAQDTSQSSRMFPYMQEQAAYQTQKIATDWHKNLQTIENMKQANVLQLLEEQYKRKAMTAVDLDNEKRVQDIIYKKYENQWRKVGVTSSDNIMLRVLVRMLGQSGLTPMDIIPKQEKIGGNEGPPSMGFNPTWK